jgi:hypothetical protein
MAEDTAQEPVRLPRVRSALALFVFEIVQLREHIHRNENMVVFKTIQAVRVVQKDIGVQDEVFYGSRCAGAVGGCQFGEKNALLFGEFRGFGSMHNE